MIEIIGIGPGFKRVRLENGEELNVPDSVPALNGLATAPEAQLAAPAPAAPPAEGGGGAWDTVKDVAGSAGRLGALTAINPVFGPSLWARDALQNPAVGEALDTAKKAVGETFSSARKHLLPNTKTGAEQEEEEKKTASAQPKATAAPNGWEPPPPSFAGTGGSGPAGTEVGARMVDRGGGAAPSFAAGGGALRKAFEEQQAAINAQVQLGQQKAAEMVGFQEELARRTAERETRLQETQKEQQAFFDREMGHYKSMVQDLRAPAAKIDPERYWKSRTTGQKIMAALGVFFGGGAKGGNPGLAYLQKAIQDDIDAQKEDISNERQGKRDALSGQQTFLGMARQRFSDSASAENAAYAAGIESVQAKISALAAKYDSPELRAKADMAIAGLEQTKQEKLIGLQQQAQENALKWANHRLQEKELGFRALQQRGTTDKDAQKMVTEVESRYRTMKTNIAKAKELIRNKGTTEWTGAHNQELDALLDDLAVDDSKLKDPSSVARPSEVELTRKSLPRIGGSGFGNNANSTALKILEAFENRLEDRRRTAFEVRGFAVPRSPGGKEELGFRAN